MLYFVCFIVWVIIVTVTIKVVQMNRTIGFIDAAKSYAIENILFYVIFTAWLVVTS